MKKLSIILVLLVASCGSQKKNEINTGLDTNRAVSRDINGFTSSEFQQLQYLILDEPQKESIKPYIETYYNSLLESKGQFENKLISRDKLRLERSFALYNYMTSVKSQLNTQQLVMLDNSESYKEKALVKELKKHGYIK